MNEKGKKKKSRSRVCGGWASFSANKTKKSSHQPKNCDYRYLDPPQYKMQTRRPRNFSWFIDGFIAGSGFPESAEHFQYIKNKGISTLITLSEFKPPMAKAPAGLTNVCIPVVEFEAPNNEQIENCMSAIEECQKNNKACVVHCFWGLGRTGTMLACYLVKHEGMDARSAIRQVRYIRQYSIETYEQEDAVFEYAEYLNKLKAQSAETSEGPSSGADDTSLSGPSMEKKPDIACQNGPSMEKKPDGARQNGPSMENKPTTAI